MKRKTAKRKGETSQAKPGSRQKKNTSRTLFGSNRPMKGQFFIVGAILICSLLFLSIPLSQPLISQPSGDITYISTNMRRELPHALNLGLNDSSELDTMVNFTHYIEAVMLERRINYTSLWLIARNQSTDGLNVTACNFLGDDVTVSINVSGTVQNLPLSNGTISYTTFSSVGTTFNITVSFWEQEETAEWVRDKVSLYAFYRLTRGEDLIMNDIMG